MAAKESAMLALGTIAPEFSLPDPDGTVHTFADHAAAFLVMFICNHCPYVKHVRAELARLGSDYLPRDVAVYAINSNDASSYPGDRPAKMKEEAVAWSYEFPYLVDAGQDVARAYRAACTPDFFVFDAGKQLVYRGQLDASRPSNDIPVTGVDIRAALEAALNGTAVSAKQVPSIGCSIKWKAGNEPLAPGR
jgi:thiol-disulfide isomerase/thioredoxin